MKPVQKRVPMATDSAKSSHDRAVNAPAVGQTLHSGSRENAARNAGAQTPGETIARGRISRRLPNGTLARGLAESFEDWKSGNERWLFISPHDDDVVMGAGILLQYAREAGISIHVAITTDGRMGYCTDEDRPRISQVRSSEARASFHGLGIEEIEWLGYPDQDLVRCAGRRQADVGDAAAIAGYTGLQNSYTALLRRTLPTRVFLCSDSDYHPDHKIVYEQALISLFHAGGDIWPELGDPIDEFPVLHEMAVYCNFASDPDVEIRGDDIAFERKLEAIAVYHSQRQIARAVDAIRANGPLEYLRTFQFSLYEPRRYASLFATDESVPTGFRGADDHV